MAYDKKYTITEGRLNRSFLCGFLREGTGRISFGRKEKDERHILILPVFHSFEKGSAWGRFHMKADLPEDCSLIIRAFARDIDTPEDETKIRELETYFRDEQIPLHEKIAVFENAESKKSMDHTDVLFYELKGQFLWICMEVSGRGEGSLSCMVLEKTGDNFMQTFPEIYQEQGGFFHRYMSVFSTLYDSVSQELEELGEYLSVEKAPEWMLPYFAKWLGFAWEGEYLEERIVRRLLKEIYHLNRIKGTKRAIGRLIEIVLEKPAVIIERNRLEGTVTGEDKKIYDRLYGCSMWDVTILVYAEANEKKKAQLEYLIMQFKPVRSHVRLVFYQKCSKLDSYCYLDKNAVLSKQEYGRMDTGVMSDGSVLLA